MRRKPDAHTNARTEPVIRQRHEVSQTTRQAAVLVPRAQSPHRARPMRPEAVSLSDLRVLDDFPADIPVSHRELEVIETYVADLVDGALTRAQ
jgi:hypothetical protein